jgi:hypothetical protein
MTPAGHHSFTLGLAEQAPQSIIVTKKSTALTVIKRQEPVFASELFAS